MGKYLHWKKNVIFKELALDKPLLVRMIVWTLYLRNYHQGNQPGMCTDVSLKLSLYMFLRSYML